MYDLIFMNDLESYFIFCKCECLQVGYSMKFKPLFSGL